MCLCSSGALREPTKKVGLCDSRRDFPTMPPSAVKAQTHQNVQTESVRPSRRDSGDRRAKGITSPPSTTDLIMFSCLFSTLNVLIKPTSTGKQGQVVLILFEMGFKWCKTPADCLALMSIKIHLKAQKLFSDESEGSHICTVLPAGIFGISTKVSRRLLFAFLASSRLAAVSDMTDSRPPTAVWEQIIGPR